MKRSTTKQQKKEELRKQTEMVNLKRRQVSEASNQIEDYFTIIPMLKQFNKNGIEAISVSYKKLPPELLEWAMKLTEENMRKVYEETWGWNEKKKLGELKHEDSRFIAVFQADKPIAFVHFRFEFEDGETTLYIYELQVSGPFQSHGIGRYLLQCVEFIAMKTKMDITMLTVLKANEGAMKFYLRNNYKLHPSSPSQVDPEAAEDFYHELLYKPICKRP